MAYILRANLEAHLLASLILQLSEQDSYYYSWLSNCFRSSSSLNGLELGEIVLLSSFIRKYKADVFIFLLILVSVSQ